jgi:hypothetical protein
MLTQESTLSQPIYINYYNYKSHLTLDIIRLVLFIILILYSTYYLIKEYKTKNILLYKNYLLYNVVYNIALICILIFLISTKNTEFKLSSKISEIKLSSNYYLQNVVFIESLLIILSSFNLFHILNLFSAFREKLLLVVMFIKSIFIYFLQIIFISLILSLALQNIYGENNTEFSNYSMAYQSSINLLISKSHIPFIMYKVSWSITLIVIASLFRLFFIRSVTIGVLTEIFRNIKNYNYYLFATESKWVLKDYITWMFGKLINY